jgi:hypothetical protein
VTEPSGRTRPGEVRSLKTVPADRVVPRSVVYGSPGGGWKRATLGLARDHRPWHAPSEAMNRLVRAELKAVIDALTQVYVDGRNDGNWHVLTFNLVDRSAVRGRVVSSDEQDAIVVGLEPSNQQVTVGWDDVQSLLIEAD